MDEGNTYGTASGLHATLYCLPEYDIPDDLVLLVDGKPVTFVLLSPVSLECRDVEGVKGHCGSFDCHRQVLGECQCGRHGRDYNGNRTRIGYSRANR